MAEARSKGKKATKKRRVRPLIEPLRNYDRAEGAAAVGCSVITLIRAYDGGHLKAYRVGRRLFHSGQHLIDWMEAGGKTSSAASRAPSVSAPSGL